MKKLQFGLIETESLGEPQLLNVWQTEIKPDQWYRAEVEFKLDSKTAVIMTTAEVLAEIPDKGITIEEQTAKQ